MRVNELQTLCIHSLQPAAAMNRETTHGLSLPGTVSTVGHTVSDSSFSENTGSTRIIVILVSLAFGISFILFLLYRITSLGSTANDRKRKKNAWNINEEECYEHMLYNTELEITHSNNNRYNIRYYSSINSGMEHNNVD
ncbi:PIR Superfamily Protein [Plasmodium ovale wallikeri]|uniref:PIR Superfamily Protein n=1 Tax=Plasmodium ovale wallikeri TaxID=864142 RepID=A0A1A9AFI7_PLAOA|nr:PIR Superfamily Protein [Plasmodium ovale wallikeri]SBT58182.1 PIR Superfamily Protein [Plasmodium ovale wallikeri]